MIEVPDPTVDDASDEDPVAVEEEAEPAQPEEAQDAAPPEPAPKKETLKDRVNCEACGREVSRFCLKYSHKCKKAPETKVETPAPPPPVLLPTA